jgi:hypothetical protein
VIIRDVLQKDPLQAELLNNGVAEVRDVHGERELRTLRYELETFVCEGQYEDGLARILGTYLKKLESPAQPAAWISGFFGSGKSHLAKMLRALWTDFEFPDGARARGIARLPQDVQDLLRELSTAGKRHGGLHAASGTLSAGSSESVRLAFLGIVFRSAGLPEKYPFARFVLWLREQGVEQRVREAVAAKSKEFERELNNLYVSPVLAGALVEALPGWASQPAEALKAIGAQFPNVKDVSNEEVHRAVIDALGTDGKLPCTLVVLDEVQQYIGENRDRSIDVQELVEFCSNKFDGRMLLVGTGQAALSGAALLERLQARFTVSVMLSDTDVEAVIRNIVLAKRPDRTAELKSVLERHSGEIARHLSGTRIGHTHADEADLMRDYPLLPVRRRFWERALRAVDRAGTAGQLRTQLKVVHEAVRAVASEPLGWVVPADYLYGQIDHDLLSTGVLLREVRDDIIEKQRDGTPDGELRARLCALIFLIGRLPREQGSDTGVRATPESLADLMVEDLGSGSAHLRERIPALLSLLVEQHYLIEVEGEYRLQTKESQGWNNDFRLRYEQLLGDDQRMEHERSDRLRHETAARFGGIKLQHGKSNVQRRLQLEYGREAPKSSGQTVPVWIRDGWQDDERTIVRDARTLGTGSPVVLVYVPKRSADELRKAVAALLASTEVLSVRPTPTTDEGREAREAMLTRQRDAEGRVRTALEGIFGGTQVYLAGGDAYQALTPEAAVKDAAGSALVRLFPQFDSGDDPKWAQVVTRARTGDGAALEAVGYKGDVDKHAVCKLVLQDVGAGKKGSDLRRTFQGVPYGWPQDTVDGAILALHSAGHLVGTRNGVAIDTRQLDQAAIGPSDFRTNTVVVTVPQKLALRQLFQQLGVHCKSGEESLRAPEFVQAALDLAARAGGDPPAPESPTSPRLIEIRGMSGNEQLAALYHEKTALEQDISHWKSVAPRIEQRVPRWKRLQELARHAAQLPVGEELAPQISSIAAQRLLLEEPDPVPSLCERLTRELRQALTLRITEYKQAFAQALSELEATPAWQQLKAEDRERILREYELGGMEDTRLGTEEEVLSALERTSLHEWSLRRDALGGRFGRALEAAVRLVTPQARRVSLPQATVTSKEEVDAWLAQVQARLMEAIATGPVIL